MQVERNGKTEKLSFTVLDTAETPLILYKDNASERNGKSGKRSFARLDTAETALILYKDKNFIDKRGHIVVERILINLFLRSVSIKC